MSNPYQSGVGHVISDSEEGGYLVPSVISKQRPSVLGWVARLFNHSYGWEDYRLADEIEAWAKTGEPIINTHDITSQVS